MSDPNIPRSERKRGMHMGGPAACGIPKFNLGMADTLDEQGMRYCAPCQTLKYTCPETKEVLQEQRICPGGRSFYIDETKDQIFEEAAKEFLDLLKRGCEIQTPGFFYDAAKQIRESGRPWTIPDLKQFFSEASDKELNIKRKTPEKMEVKAEETPTTVTRSVHYSCEVGKGDKVGLVEKQESVTVPYVSDEDWEKLAARVEKKASDLGKTICGYGYKLVSTTMELTPEEEKAKAEKISQQPNPILEWSRLTQEALPNEFKK